MKVIWLNLLHRECHWVWLCDLLFFHSRKVANSAAVWLIFLQKSWRFSASLPGSLSRSFRWICISLFWPTDFKGRPWVQPYLFYFQVCPLCAHTLLKAFGVSTRTLGFRTLGIEQEISAECRHREGWERRASDEALRYGLPDAQWAPSLKLRPPFEWAQQMTYLFP